MKKQFAYAEKKGIPYVAIIGETEMNENTVTLKKLSTGDQSTFAVDMLLQKIIE
jgi:histidyl-tRNA synthetase